MNKYFLPFTFLFATCVLLVLYVKNSAPKPSSVQGRVKYDQIQRYQKEAARKMELRKGRAEYERMGGAPQIQNGVYQKEGTFDKTRLVGHQDNEDLEEESYGGAVTLDQKMDNFLATRQKFSELEDRKKEVYIEQFKLEARAMGFEVKIDKNMEIVDVRKIQKK